MFGKDTRRRIRKFVDDVDLFCIMSKRQINIIPTPLDKVNQLENSSGIKIPAWATDPSYLLRAKMEIIAQNQNKRLELIGNADILIYEIERRKQNADELRVFRNALQRGYLNEIQWDKTKCCLEKYLTIRHKNKSWHIQAAEYLKNNPEASLESIANNVGVNKSTLSRDKTFKKMRTAIQQYPAPPLGYFDNRSRTVIPEDDIPPSENS